ncbi:MAG TPA: TolC family protein [Rhodospirillales bacterium]|nr:TolC family protein [Rhodospirillales bacterium]HJO68342.1 TolC family protein [Rhodospirillales bacterium]
MQENPAVGNSDATIEVTRERQRAIRAEYLPTFDMVGTANNENNNNATIGTRRDYSVILQATWDLFTGFSTQASMAQAAFDYGASKDNYAFVIRKVVEQVRLSWQALLTVRERLELLENAINIASEVFDSRQKLREAGKETVINVLDAESEIFNAQINFTAASYDERIAVFQLLMAMGRLDAQNLNLAAID